MLIKDLIFFILVAVLAFDAFEGYSIIKEIFKVCLAPDMEYTLFRWKRDILSKSFL